MGRPDGRTFREFDVVGAYNSNDRSGQERGMDSLDTTFRHGAETIPPLSTPRGMPSASPGLRPDHTSTSLPKRVGGFVWRQIKRWRRVLIPIGIVIAAIAAFIALSATAPEVQREAKPERVWSVDAVVAERSDHQPKVQLLGTLTSGRSVDLRALVSGTVAEVSPALNDGGVVRQGDLLMSIEALDYELALAETKALLDEAKARLDETRVNVAAERQQLDLRQRELDRNQELFKNGTIAAPRLEQTQIAVAQQEQSFTAAEARVRQQQAVVDRLTAALTKAETDLQRTRLVAPFDGFIGSVNAEQGMRVGPADRVAVLSGSTGLEALLTLPTDTYGRLVADGEGVIGRPAEVVWMLGETRLSYPAHVERVIDRINTATGGVGVFVRLDGNFIDAPLRPGAFVQVLLPDRAYAGVIKLPPTALHGEDRVYVVNGEGRLEARTVEVVSRDGGRVYIGSGLQDGDKIVTTRFQEISPGLKVTVRGETPPATGTEGADAKTQDEEAAQ